MLRPVDMALTIQNAADAHRISTTDAQARPEAHQQMFADRLLKQAREETEQVQKANTSERASVNPDGRGPGGSYTPNRKKSSQKKPQGQTAKRSTGESLFDVSV